MASTLRTLVVALGVFFSVAANARPQTLTGAPAVQQADCVSWYSPQLRNPPETCNDVVNTHPGLDLATFLALNPSIHPYCDNMQLGPQVCIKAIKQETCSKPAEPSAPPQASPQATSSIVPQRWR